MAWSRRRISAVASASAVGGTGTACSRAGRYSVKVAMTARRVVRSSTPRRHGM